MSESAFEFVLELPIRYRDLDPLNHVNNTVYATYLEQARIDYLDAVLEAPLDDREFVLVHLEIDYRDSIEYDDDLSVALRVTDIGTTSLSFGYEVRADDTVAATGETTQVFMGDDRTPTPLPEAWRETIRQFEPGLDA